MVRRIVDVAGIGPGDLAAWRDLAGRAAEPNVFYEPEFLVPTQRWFGVGRGIRLLVVRDAGRWQAVLPFEHVPADRWWPLPHASNAGPALFEYTSLGTPLVDGDAPGVAAGLLVDALAAARRTLGLAVVLHLVGAGGPVLDGLRARARARGLGAHVWGGDERAAVDLAARPGWSWEAGATGSRAAEHRRKVRRLARDLGAPDATPRPVPCDPEAYLDFEATTWKGGPDGPAFRRRAGGARWFADVLRGFAADGRAWQHEISGPRGVAYAGVVLRSGGTVFGWYDAYHGDYARSSPGTVGRLLAAEQVGHEPGVRLLDTCMDPCRYPDQTAHYPDRVRTSSFTLGLAGGPVRALVHGRREAGRLSRGVRGLASASRSGAR
ncbi:GNAT family N-acetyltransferase [Isoptericola sp. BMS4]|uniref:GNAT family N-acetyltransferase n=1 Tax=Isoptericola sp. BMS4 TaxID=2527875 RepID=UPI001421F958|nr:GNAT family N-acetyltransferase [Isoptericola sp. BMS4]